MVNFDNDGEPPVRWLNVAGFCIEFKSGVTTSWLAKCVLRHSGNGCGGFYFLQISNCISVPCVFEGTEFFSVKNAEVAICYPIHIHPAVLLPLSPKHSLILLFQADTAELSAVTHIPHFLTLFCTFCRRQSSERLQSKCFVVNS